MLTNGTIFYKSGQNLVCADGIDIGMSQQQRNACSVH